MVYLKYLYFSLIIYVLVEFTIAFTPTSRYAHASSLIRNKLYFLGGTGSEFHKDLFYLDLSASFTLEIPPWNDISSVSFLMAWGATSIGALGGGKEPFNIIIFGGFRGQNSSLNSFVYSFNINTYETSAINIRGSIQPEGRRNFRTAMLNNGRNIYIFGGNSNTTGLPEDRTWFNDLLVFDTVGLSFSLGSNINSPLPRDLYTMTMLSNGFLIFIGGKEFSGKSLPLKNVEMDHINIYDTNSDVWSLMIADMSNLQIDARHSHSAVLTTDSRIIIYGGTTSLSSYGDLGANPELAILDTNTSPFKWSVPEVSFSNAGKPPVPLIYHTAELFGNYMIIGFGNLTSSKQTFRSSNIYLYNIKNNSWVTRFDPTTSNNISPSTSPSTSPTASTSNESKLIIIIGILSGLIGIAILSLLGYFTYKWRSKKKADETDDNVIGIPGTNDYLHN